jgi:hypothetical protein
MQRQKITGKSKDKLSPRNFLQRVYIKTLTRIAFSVCNTFLKVYLFANGNLSYTLC